MLKMEWVIKMWLGDSSGGEKIEFLATVEDHNPPVGKILACILKNHNLLFIIFCNLLLKTLESILGTIKKYLVMNN